MREYVIRLVDQRVDTEENYKKGMDVLRKFYKFAFSDDNKYGYFEGNLDVPANFKTECLRICNNV